MFIVELTYQAPLAKIDAQMRPHVAFLKKHYASGNFLISGRQNPRTGGIIVAVAKSRERRYPQPRGMMRGALPDPIESLRSAERSLPTPRFSLAQAFGRADIEPLVC